MNPAGRLQAKLGALSQRERLLLFLCAAAIVAFGFVRWGVYPALASYKKTQAEIPQRLSTIARYRLAAQGEARIDEAFADAAARLEEMEDGILPGDNPAAAGSALQGILKPMLERPDTRMTSVRTLSPVQKGPYAEVAVQLDFQTTTEGLASLLAAVPRHPKILKIRKLSVHAGFFSAASAGARRDTLTASVVVAGLADTAVESRGERAEE
jgi:hypothetical protein